MALNCSTRGGRGYGEGTPSDQESHPDPAACGRCRSCRKISSGNHPDILRLKPSGTYIRIDQIRELCRVLAMKPYEAEYRIAMILDAHLLNPEAGNALLKMLEEPPDRTILVLTATATADMLPTIVSRCRRIRFNPIPAHLLARELVETQGMDAHGAHALAVLSGGSLSKAGELSRTNWIQRRQWLLDNFDALAPRDRNPRDTVRLMAMASTLYPDKTSALDLLELLKTIYRDLLIYNYRPDRLLNPDASEMIAGAAGRMEEEDIMAAVKAVDATMDRIRWNANPRLALETLFLTLAKYPEMN
jgi:DNA polymerase-3 subunit delta'